MKTKSWLSLGLFTMVVVFNSCYYDHFDALYPSVVIIDACDTTRAYTYAASIQFIMAESCISCHNSSSQSGSVNLDNYNGVVSQIANGKLVGTIDRASGYKAMPPTASLRQCEIDKIKTWITNGYKQ